jgi:hypothetical protein
MKYRVFTKHKLSWSLDLGLSFLHNCGEEITILDKLNTTLQFVKSAQTDKTILIKSHLKPMQ